MYVGSSDYSQSPIFTIGDIAKRQSACPLGACLPVVETNLDWRKIMQGKGAGEYKGSPEASI